MLGLNFPLTPFAAMGPEWLITWLTPMWILGVGVLAGLLILTVLWGLLFVVSPRAGKLIPEMIGEGAMLPTFVVTIIFAIFGLAGSLFVRAPVEMLSSVPRFLQTGTSERTIQLPPTPTGEFHRESVAFLGQELSYFRIAADQPIFFGLPNEAEDGTEDEVATTNNLREVTPGKEFDWLRGPNSISPFGDEQVDTLLIVNDGDTDANITLEVKTEPVYPQMSTVIVTAIAVVGLYLIYFLQHWLFPKLSAVALSTTKSEMAQPLFIIAMAVGAFLLFIFIWIPYNTFGEDIKMLKDTGFSTIMVLCIFQSVWAASNSVSEEIEGKTALTVLSKPIGRPQFILGKFFGIAWSSAVIFIVLGGFFLVLVSYKPVYDARESAKLAPLWETCHFEVVRTVPGLVLAFFETLVLAAVSVAISTRLPLLANASICFAVYALGHLTPLIVQSSVGSLPPVRFMGNLIATVLPMLDAYNIQAAVATGKPVPYAYLANSLFYCVLYSAVAMLLALVLFEDRDLA